MIIRLGLYFGGLAVDYISGEAETQARVQLRAGQLRCALEPCPVPCSWCTVLTRDPNM